MLLRGRLGGGALRRVEAMMTARVGGCIRHPRHSSAGDGLSSVEPSRGIYTVWRSCAARRADPAWPPTLLLAYPASPLYSSPDSGGPIRFTPNSNLGTYIEFREPARPLRAWRLPPGPAGARMRRSGQRDADSRIRGRRVDRRRGARARGPEPGRWRPPPWRQAAHGLRSCSRLRRRINVGAELNWGADRRGARFLGACTDRVPATGSTR